MKSSRQFWGVFLLVAPFFGLGLVLTAYPIIAFVVAQLSYKQEQIPMVALLLPKLVSILGIVCLVGFVFGLPVGLYLLVTSAKKAASPIPAPENLPQDNAIPEHEDFPDQTQQ
jgi:hypothetical protein